MKKYFFKNWCVCAVLAFPCVVCGETVNVNFGRLEAAGWNMAASCAEGAKIDPLYDADGVPTGMSFEIISKFGNINSSGPTATTTILDLPAEVSQESFWGNNGSVGQIEIAGLDAERKYTFYFYGGRMECSDNRYTTFVVEGNNQKADSINTSRNLTDVSVFTDMEPTADGKMTVSVRASSNNDNGTKYYHLGAMRIVTQEGLPSGISGKSENRFRVYPNPVKDMLHIEGMPYDAVAVFDVTGRVVMTGGGSSVLDLSGIPCGYYWIRISSETAETEIYKIVKR